MVIQKTSLADEVANQIKLAIQSGQYSPNQKLPVEAELMKLFGVGRSTIREAIRMLANAGFLRVQQGVGTFIQETTQHTETLQERLKRAQTKDINEVRHLLEIQIVQQAAKNHTQLQIDTIDVFLRQRGQAIAEGKLNEYIQADISFHLAIAQACGNEILSDLYKAFSAPLKNWFLQYYRDDYNTSTFIESQARHQLLFDSIKERDAEKARTVISQILDHIQYI